MGSKTLVYKQKVLDNLNVSLKHLKRIDDAFNKLEKKHKFPIQKDDFENILTSIQNIAYSDQIIYRFSKLQDTIGAKLFKSILLYQGENINKPFLDILNQLEYMDIIDVDEWFEIRDLRNEIAHDYETNDNTAINILNSIYILKEELQKTLNTINKLIS